MALTSVLNDRTARYFDLINQPDSLKRIDGSSISNPEFQDCPASGTTIPADWDVNTGDVLNWSKGRPTDAYFVLDNRTLLKNPDRTGSGYLTIPLIVTRTHLKSNLLCTDMFSFLPPFRKHSKCFVEIWIRHWCNWKRLCFNCWTTSWWYLHSKKLGHRSSIDANDKSRIYLRSIGRISLCKSSTCIEIERIQTRFNRHRWYHNMVWEVQECSLEKKKIFLEISPLF